jgi:hypothetical protein
LWLEIYAGNTAKYVALCSTKNNNACILANEAKGLGYGGISIVSRISGISRVTITHGMAEINEERYQPQADIRCRKEGGGRKTIEAKDPGFLKDLENLIEAHTLGDPENHCSKSLKNLETALNDMGYRVSDTTIGEKLKKQGFSLQLNMKDLSILPDPVDRNKQFEHINDTARKYIKAHQPVISIDTKKRRTLVTLKITDLNIVDQKHL